jgi:hypothetical protein
VKNDLATCDAVELICLSPDRYFLISDEEALEAWGPDYQQFYKWPGDENVTAGYVAGKYCKEREQGIPMTIGLCLALVSMYAHRLSHG